MENTEANELIETIKEDMRRAMKNRQRVELNELRSLLARISNAEAISEVDLNTGSPTSLASTIKGVGNTEMQRRVLSTKDIKSIILAEQQEMEVGLSRIAGDTEYAASLRTKIALIQKYL